MQRYAILEKAPWDVETVTKLNKHQNSKRVHPYTCGKDHGKEVKLLATTKGWVCQEKDCTYTQDWYFGEMMEFPD